MDLCGEFREAGGKVAISLAVFRSEIAANVEAGIQFPKRKTKTITDGVFFGVLREEKSGDFEKFILTLESNRRSLAKLFPDPAWVKRDFALRQNEGRKKGTLYLFGKVECPLL